MTQTNPPSAQQSATVADAGISVRSADILLNLIVILLAPIFLSASDGDINLARRAAVETVNAYRAQNYADLLAVAQIVAFGFATLGSLCLSMGDDLSLSMVLRLRGNANALSRSAKIHRRRLEQSRADTSQQPPFHPTIPADDSSAQPPPVTPPEPPRQAQPTEKDIAPAVTPAPVSTPSTPETDDTQTFWAAALTEAAEQFTAELPHLSPAEQRSAAIQIAALNSCASDLLSEATAQRPEPSQRSSVQASQPVPASVAQNSL